MIFGKTIGVMTMLTVTDTDTFLNSWVLLLGTVAPPPQVLEQNVFNLDAGVDSLEVCEGRDIAIAVLAGEGDLSLPEEVVALTPGRFIFIPAHIPHRLKSNSSLVYLLSCYESGDSTDDLTWVVDL
jgi:mannose-6-phosphate isomerase-like protein (cupin superfamily)